MHYRYRMLYRPPSFCTLPRGLLWEYAEVPAGHPNPFDLPVTRHPFGVISVARKLDADELASFEIVEVQP